MKQLIIILTFILAFCNFIFAQPLSFEFDKIREIKLLESTRDDVRRILADYKMDNLNDKDYYQDFSKKDIKLSVSFSNGKCSDDQDEWNVPEWKVVSVEISFYNEVQIDNSGIDFSKFKKERHLANVPESYVYHDRDSGILFKVDDSEIEKIVLFPPKKSSSLLCDKEREREFYLGKSIFGDSKLEDRNLIIDIPASVEDLTLSTSEVMVSCSALDSTKNKDCSNGAAIILVSTKSNDPESDDVLTFNYTVSGGKIIGKGSNVIWYLSNVKPGTYTITAGVDDGCGVCGPTKTKKIVVK